MSKSKNVNTFAEAQNKSYGVKNASLNSISSESLSRSEDENFLSEEEMTYEIRKHFDHLDVSAQSLEVLNFAISLLQHRIDRVRVLVKEKILDPSDDTDED